VRIITRAGRRGVFIKGPFSVCKFKRVVPAPAGSGYERGGGNTSKWGGGSGYKWGGRCRTIQDICTNVVLAIGNIFGGYTITQWDHESILSVLHLILTHSFGRFVFLFIL
jgi:hypothetical protein